MVLTLLTAAILTQGPFTLEQRREPAAVRQTTAIGSKVVLGPAFGVGVAVNAESNWARFQLRIGYEFAPIDNRLQISLVLPLGLLAAEQQDLGFRIQSTGFELTPGARINVFVIPNLGLYFDVGAGLTAYSFGAQITNNLRGAGSSAGFALRTAIGLEYRVMDLIGVYLEPIGLFFQTAESANLTFGSVTTRTNRSFPIQWTFLVGVNFRI